HSPATLLGTHIQWFINTNLSSASYTASVTSNSSEDSEVLVCSAYNFYPQQIRLSWLRDGVVIPDPPGMMITEMPGGECFSFQPQSDDVVECSVQHQALSRPLITTWSKTVARSAAAWVCLSLGLLCIALGVIIFIISAKESLRHKLSDFWRAAYQRVAG
uniref:Ig-like domain-containing protein n=1 Tax=Oreochromis niloticus TaxID=8128 RepID=A0A669CEV8_ORENI